MSCSSSTRSSPRTSFPADTYPGVGETNDAERQRPVDRRRPDRRGAGLRHHQSAVARQRPRAARRRSRQGAGDHASDRARWHRDPAPSRRRARTIARSGCSSGPCPRRAARSAVGIHAPAIEDALGVEAVPDPRAQAGKRRFLGLKHRHRGAQRGIGPNQGGMAARLRDPGANCAGAAVLGVVHGQPQKTARPVREPGEIERPLEVVDDAGTGRGWDRDPPQRDFARQRRDIADRPPQGLGVGGSRVRRSRQQARGAPSAGRRARAPTASAPRVARARRRPCRRAPGSRDLQRPRADRRRRRRRTGSPSRRAGRRTRRARSTAGTARVQARPRAPATP